jgi:hypothetical protein
LSESTLSLKLADLSSEVGVFLGFGPGADKGGKAWTDYAKARIKSCVDSGLRKVYFPVPLQGESEAHSWSFLRPVATLQLPAGQSVIPCPDDFGGIEGQITLISPTSQVTFPLNVTGPGQIRARFALIPSATGRPLMIAEEAIKRQHDGAGQRKQLLVYPAADTGYSLQLTYYVLPDCLTPDWPYALGGAEHAETFLEACLAVAEQRLDDAQGVHANEFMKQLAASISLDRRHKAQLLGYNGDRSDGRRFDRRDLYAQGLVTVNGVLH